MAEKRSPKEMTDAELAERLAVLEQDAKRIREERVGLAAERDSRNQHAEDVKLARRLGPEKLARLAALAQTIKPVVVGAGGDAKAASAKG